MIVQSVQKLFKLQTRANKWI